MDRSDKGWNIGQMTVNHKDTTTARNGHVYTLFVTNPYTDFRRWLNVVAA